MVPNRQTRRPALVIDDDDEDEKTRVYAGSLSGVLDALEERWPEERPEQPSGSWSESRSGLALSRTLRPLAAGLRSFPFAYVFAIAALGMSGAAWYLSRTAPVDAGPPAAAAAAPAGAKASQPVAAAPPVAQASAEIAPAASVAPAKPAPVAQPPTKKTPIDVMSLPVAPPAANRTTVRSTH
jgi:hypothetical protein